MPAHNHHHHHHHQNVVTVMYMTRLLLLSVFLTTAVVHPFQPPQGRKILPKHSLNTNNLSQEQKNKKPVAASIITKAVTVPEQVNNNNNSTTMAAATTPATTTPEPEMSSSLPSSTVVVADVRSTDKILSRRRKPTADAQYASTDDGQQQQLGILRVVGPDAKGILAAFSQTMYGHGCGIVESEQHTDHASKQFFQRLLFDYSTMHTDRNALEVGIREVSQRLNMTTCLNWNERPKRIAIMVSKYDHVLWEILLRHQSGELPCDIACIISNHGDLQYIAEAFDIPFHVYPVTKETKANVEEAELQLLDSYNVDLVILARYMQIISDDFCNHFPSQVINIHHSFLPAFVGGKPYHRAYDRGVKLIGATAHYATADLDEGPIIEQDIMRISHRDSVQDLIQKGRILEKNTLVTAVKAHLEDRIIVYNNKCVVFDG